MAIPGSPEKFGGAETSSERQEPMDMGMDAEQIEHQEEEAKARAEALEAAEAASKDEEGDPDAQLDTDWDELVDDESYFEDQLDDDLVETKFAKREDLEDTTDVADGAETAEDETTLTEKNPSLLLSDVDRQRQWDTWWD